MIASPQAQLDINNAARGSYNAQDSKLNDLYNKLYALLKMPAKSALLASERAWIKFRDNECIFESSGVSGGSSKDMVTFNCLDALTRNRIDQIQHQLNCEEGDLSCVRLMSQ
jgi:uncharacterized protein YecT (DUF1311 family)